MTLLDQFLADHPPGSVTIRPGDDTPQCVDLADAWGAFIGKPLPGVIGAIDLAGPGIPGYQWVWADGTQLPFPGDLVVWGSTVGKNGHVDLCVGPVGSSQFRGLDQNWVDASENGSPAAYVIHDYAGVLGYQRPIGLIPLPTEERHMRVVTTPPYPVPPGTAPNPAFVVSNEGKRQLYTIPELGDWLKMCGQADVDVIGQFTLDRLPLLPRLP